MQADEFSCRLQYAKLDKLMESAAFAETAPKA
jgi:hypothetical protein